MKARATFSLGCLEWSTIKMSSIWLQLEFVVVCAAVIVWEVKNIQLILWLLYLRLQLIYQLFLKTLLSCQVKGTRRCSWWIQKLVTEIKVFFRHFHAEQGERLYQKPSFNQVKYRPHGFNQGISCKKNPQQHKFKLDSTVINLNLFGRKLNLLYMTIPTKSTPVLLQMKAEFAPTL